MANVVDFPLPIAASDDDIPLEPESDDIPIEPEGDVEIPIEPEDPPPSDPLPAAIVSSALVEILPADFPLPLLARFIPNPALRTAVGEAARYALAVDVAGVEGLQRGDLALTALRTRLKAIDEHFDEPVRIANDLHKRLTGIRGEWQADGKAALQTVGTRLVTEQRRLEAIAAEERRRAQAEADRLAREAAEREVREAEQAKAPAPVVEELKRQAETATAPPVAPPPAPIMRGSTTVVTWKARIAGTPGSDDPNPCVADLSPAQRAKMFDLLKAIVDGRAPLTAIDLNWSYLNSRAKADKSAMGIPGIEAYEQGSVRAKSTRGR